MIGTPSVLILTVHLPVNASKILLEMDSNANPPLSMRKVFEFF